MSSASMENSGNDLPELCVRPPGPESRSWLTRYALRAAPMGHARTPNAEVVSADVPPGAIVLSGGVGSNAVDVDANRYVDLAAGFGSLLLGHNPEAVRRAIDLQSSRLMQALGDVYPSDAKIGLLERLARLHWDAKAKVILGQSGADAITAAIKSAVLATKRTGLIAFGSSYHGLSYGALTVTDLRAGYRAPFAEHLSSDVGWLSFPRTTEDSAASLSELESRLRGGDIAAVVIEPILGRGGVIELPDGFLNRLGELTRRYGTLCIADEIWTGLGRAGKWLVSDASPEFRPDLVCIGKGLGGGMPISACLGSAQVMSAWSQDDEVVHTSTFAGAPLAAACAIATLDQLSRHRLIERAEDVGARWKARLEERLAPQGIEVRGRGLMVGLEIPGGHGGRLQRALLERGFMTSTGGGARDVLVLTPPLTISEELLEAFDDALLAALSALSP